MNIAILTPTFSHHSGIDRVVGLQAEQLVKGGHTVLVMCLEGTMRSQQYDVIRLESLKGAFWERIHRLFFFLDRKRIKKAALLLKKYDLIISHLYPMNSIACYAKKKYGIRYRYHNHGVATPSLFSSFYERVYMTLFRWFTNKSARCADEVVSISNYLRKVFLKENAIDSVIEYDSIDIKRFHKGITGTRIRKKYNLQEDPVCLYVGRISPHKGLHLLIEAFFLAKKEVPSLKLLIAGTCAFRSYKERLQKMSDDSIIFAGFVPDDELPEYYASCDVYTTATLWEGFNMTVVEANTVGKVVVAFDIGPHQETIKQGTLVPVNNTALFAKAIIKTIKTISS